MNSFTFKKGVDAHGHFRGGAIEDPEQHKLRFIVPHVTRDFQIGQAMPNPNPPILTGDDSNAYRRRIVEVAREAGYKHFDVIQTIKAVPTMRLGTVQDAWRKSVRSIKFYFKDTTTHSEDGIDPDLIWAHDSVFRFAQDVGMIISGHFEVDVFRGIKSDRYQRERAAMPLVREMHERYPKLKIIVEHVSTSEMCQLIDILPANVAATLTVHHQLATVHDMIGTKVRPDLVCQPLLQEFRDRDAIIDRAVSGNPKYMYGGDNALHLAGAKYCYECCSGIFNTTVATALNIQRFDERNRLQYFDGFNRLNAQKYFGIIPEVEEEITYERVDWTVPAHYDVPGTNDIVVPFWDRKVLKWKFVA